MFRSRFTDAFPPKCPHFGPQDIERGVADTPPSSQIESLLCALLGLVLNRKKPVESVSPSFPPNLCGFGSRMCAIYLRETALLTPFALHRKGHYGRALEEAIQTQKSQWPKVWNYVNPLSGSRSFNTMTPTERVRVEAMLPDPPLDMTNHYPDHPPQDASSLEPEPVRSRQRYDKGQL